MLTWPYDDAKCKGVSDFAVSGVLISGGSELSPPGVGSNTRRTPARSPERQASVSRTKGSNETRRARRGCGKLVGRGGTETEERFGTGSEVGRWIKAGGGVPR